MSSPPASQPPAAGPTRRIRRWQKAKLPILAGPLRGTRWLPASGGKLARIFSGKFESEQTAMFQRFVGAGDVVFDVGASVGYYTLLSARLVGSRGQVVAFEPCPKNAAFLREHVAANGYCNVAVQQAAVAETAGVARFAAGSGTGTGHLASTGSLQVAVTNLDTFLAAAALRPTHIKVDVEGAEISVLRGARETLAATRPTLFLSTHGPEIHQACCEFLRAMNYRLLPIVGTDLETTYEVLCRAA